jgi:hypothetical protein
MMKSKTRAIGKWHGLKIGTREPIFSPSHQATQRQRIARWTVNRNLLVTDWEVQN